MNYFKDPITQSELDRYHRIFTDTSEDYDQPSLFDM